MAESFAARKKWLTLAVLFGAAFGDLAQAEDQPLYGRWWTVCDNAKACGVYGAGGERGVGAALVLLREAGPEGLPRISLVTDPPRTPEGAPNWRVTVDGFQVAVVQARPEDDILRADLTPAQASTLLRRLPGARELRIEGPGADTAIALADAPEALRRADLMQGRAGGVTALLLKGRAPAGAVPPPPSLPVVEAPRSSAQSESPREGPDGLRRELRDCERVFRTDIRSKPPQAYRLGGDAQLWLTPCGAAASADYRLVLLSDGDGDKTRPALPGAGPIDGAPDSVRAQVSFDPATGVLSVLEAARGFTDCGRASDWVWTGQKFVRVREREMAECVGLPLSLWPDSYRALVRRVP